MRTRLYAAVGACLAVAAFTVPGVANAGPAVAATTAVSAGSGANPTSARPAPTAAEKSAAATAPATKAPVTLPSGAKDVCPKPESPLQEQCQSIIVPHTVKPKAGITPDYTVGTGPLQPLDFQTVYGLEGSSGESATNGTGETVAIVDAYGDPDIDQDLSAYRSAYSLSACDEANGCLHVYNESGEASPLPTVPSTETGWETETALDAEMVSAICPNCSIDIFEASSTALTDLGTAENSAAAKDKFVSNSWSGSDVSGESVYDAQYFDHPGVAITFASGDNGYGTDGYEASYPASSPFVTSVGGTQLVTSDEVGSYSQQVWDDANGATGSGCSSGESKPTWQTDSGCENRTQNDVSAIADAEYGIDVYSSAAGCDNIQTGECAVAGTSASAPIIAAMYALAGTPAPGTYPVSYLYQNPSDLTPITDGGNGQCESTREYLCNAGFSLSDGYNGPAGLGTPGMGGTTEAGNLTPFKETESDDVSVFAPGPTDLEEGVAVAQNSDLQALGSAQSGQALTYSATGLPAGLSIDPATGYITGTPTATGASSVTVSATDGTETSSDTFQISVVGSLTSAYHSVAGPVKLDWDSKCLDDTNGSTADGNKIQLYTCNGESTQNWTYEPDGGPGDAGELTHGGKCLDIVGYGTSNGSKLDLWSCTGASNQQWYLVGAYGELYNPVSGKCVDDPYNSETNGTQLDIWTCNEEPWQAWTPPASPVLSGISGKCLDDTNGSTADGNKIQLYSCNGETTQRFTLGLDGTIEFGGKCLDATGYGTADGTKIQLYSCGGTLNQEWEPTGYGQIENVNAEKCLDATSSANGTQLTLEDCYGDAGSVWDET